MIQFDSCFSNVLNTPTSLFPALISCSQCLAFALKARVKLRVSADSAFALTLPDASTNPKVSTIHPLRCPDFDTLFLGAGWSFGWRDGRMLPRTVKLLGGQLLKEANKYKKYSGWWFQILFIFIPIWGNDPFWRACLSDGLKPPTSIALPKGLHSFFLKILSSHWKVAPGHL